MKRSALLKYLMKSKHLAGCKHKKGKCTCGFMDAIDDYQRLLTIQATHYRKLSEEIMKDANNEQFCTSAQ